MVRTQIQLTEAQVRALKALASAQNRSVADLIREGVEILLRATPTLSREEQKRRAIAIAGKFNSGLPNLAVEHDRYLAETYNE